MNQDAEMQASAITGPAKWDLSNDRIGFCLYASRESGLVLESLSNAATGFDWIGSPRPSFIRAKYSGKLMTGTGCGEKYRQEALNRRKLDDGSAMLEVRIAEASDGIGIALCHTLYPHSGVIGFKSRLENASGTVLKGVKWISPFCIRIRHDGNPLRFHNINKMRGRRTEASKGPLHCGETVSFDGWLGIEDVENSEMLLIAMDQAGYYGDSKNVFDFRICVECEKDDFLVYVVPHEQTENIITHELESGGSIEAPEVFMAVAHGGLDEACNELRRVLQLHVIPTLPDDAPLLSYNAWYTDDSAERLLLEDLELAAWMGFDVFCLDASWNEGGSVIPATNDWTAGLGSYHESKVKFPGGMEHLSEKIHEKGLKFGIWIDPQNVDRKRVLSGEIPRSWIACSNGRELGCDHPSLSVSTQLCLGNPEVVSWLKEQIASMIEKWKVDWIKWDPSATESLCCDRTDHGHAEGDGAYAYIKARREIWAYLLERFPKLIGWECISDLRHSRLNPGCSYVLPAYVNTFVTGPMLGPYVWGSMHMAFATLDAEFSLYPSSYYERSYLDYYFRNLLAIGGLSMGNITGIVSQRLRNAPLGFNDAFKRNIIHFKQFRHLYRENVYHPLPEVNEKWRAVEYCKRDASEAVLFVFRDGSPAGDNRIALSGLDTSAEYIVSSLNDRPGREKIIRGSVLADEGIAFSLPDPYLATGGMRMENFPDTVRPDMERQIMYGSDVLILTKRIYK